jgi:hypothetical protein
MSVEITAFAKSGGALSKRISLGPDGKPISDGSACVMSRGKASRLRLANVTELARCIGSLDTTQAIALGALRHGLPAEVEITTKAKLEMNGAPGIIARTSEHIAYHPERPAYALLDYDPKGMPEVVRARIDDLGGFRPTVASVIPALKNTAGVMRRSTSTGLYRTDTGEELPGSNGLHVYVPVQDGADIDRFLKALHDRCWLAGLGWMMVGAGGQLLERSVVDRTVGGPERLVFEGPPVLDPPLAQYQDQRRPIVLNGDYLDTIAACPPLTIVEQARLQELHGKEAHRLAPESAKARKAFILDQAKRYGVAPEVIARQCQGVLLPAIVLPFDDPDLAGTTVADVLANPERYEKATLADPLEGIEYGRCKAKIMLRADGAPMINSYAHGRTTYELKWDAAAVEAAINKAPADKAASIFVRLALAADLDPEQLEQLSHLTAQRSGAGKRPIDRKLKAAQTAHAKQRAEEERNRQAAERRDPRPRLAAPAANAEWLPQMATLNEVLGKCRKPLPPARDMDAEACRLKQRLIPRLHLLATSASNRGEPQ